MTAEERERMLDKIVAQIVQLDRANLEKVSKFIDNGCREEQPDLLKMTLDGDFSSIPGFPNPDLIKEVQQKQQKQQKKKK